MQSDYIVLKIMVESPGSPFKADLGALKRYLRPRDLFKRLSNLSRSKSTKFSERIIEARYVHVVCSTDSFYHHILISAFFSLKFHLRVIIQPLLWKFGRLGNGYFIRYQRFSVAIKLFPN